MEQPIKMTHVKSGDYDALIAHAIDMKDAAWARSLHADKVNLKAMEEEMRADIGLMN